MFCKGDAGGMRRGAHDCLGHAAVGGVVEGVAALSEVVPRCSLSTCACASAILEHTTIHN